MMTEYTTITACIDEGILTLTLNRPDHLNAFTVGMADELVDAFTKADSDDAVKAVIVTGAGRAFCAGMDLSAEGNVFGLDESMSPGLKDLRERFHDADIVGGVRDTGGRVSLAIFACGKPVIGAINGPAVGVGATMTLPMDVRIAAEDARIGFVFGKLGIVPEACSSWFLPRIVGLSRALELVYSAEIITAAEAHDAGLVRSVVGGDELLPMARRVAGTFVRDRSQVAVALTRQMMYRNSGLQTPVEAHLVESLAMFYTSQGDGREGVSAFLGHRRPQFRGGHSERPPFYPWFDDAPKRAR